ncbi:SRPBCC family protein [Phytohabitans houttuyneae]|uniref:SRPBCC family protein n=1 Tax=Phytohabitans houttuyneae TaxID=1076126 RepID=A0A6V8KI70_9ACTN|nr:SRPBCC family protein [Phytohabitans houttuyneae]GFJ81696.1 hypothetical protein Phou_058760 [Phytohabitans houttuyneae]
MNRRVSWTLAAAGLGAALASTYPLLLRDRCLHWGATPDEVIREIPGDDLVIQPDVLSTRAVTIDAPPEAIWPWLVQMGSRRGGAYTYDWIENLFGLDMHSADEILPEFQDLKAGDVLPIGADGPSMTVEIFEPERVLCLRADNAAWVWTFALYPVDGGTRLISRNVIATPYASAVRRLYNMFVLEPGSLLMERKMLLGIKERAERTARGRQGMVASQG